MVKTSINWKISKNNIPTIQRNLEPVIEKALNEIGIKAVKFAVDNITEQSAVDTGLLRNSLTYAVGGKAPKKPTYTGGKGQHSGRIPNPKTGRYSGSAPAHAQNRRTVYVGTNVYYGVYVEMGTSKMRARPYLRPAIEDHIPVYKKIIEDELAKLAK